MSVTRFFLLGGLMLCACVLSIGSAQSAVVYTVNMSGSAENPPNASPGTGSGTITFDDAARTMLVQVSFSGLTGTTTAAHIHSSATNAPNLGNTGVASQTPSFSGFPTNVTSGSMNQLFDMTLASSFNSTYITNNGGTPLTAFSALMQQAAEGRAYFNVHTTAFPSGEIRGFLTAVPEPSGLLVTGSLLAGMVFRRQRRR